MVKSIENVEKEARFHEVHEGDIGDRLQSQRKPVAHSVLSKGTAQEERRKSFRERDFNGKGLRKAPGDTDQTRPSDPPGPL